MIYDERLDKYMTEDLAHALSNCVDNYFGFLYMDMLIVSEFENDKITKANYDKLYKKKKITKKEWEKISDKIQNLKNDFMDTGIIKGMPVDCDLFLESICKYYHYKLPKKISFNEFVRVYIDCRHSPINVLFRDKGERNLLMELISHNEYSVNWIDEKFLDTVYNKNGGLVISTEDFFPQGASLETEAVVDDIDSRLLDLAKSGVFGISHTGGSVSSYTQASIKDESLDAVFDYASTGVVNDIVLTKKRAVDSYEDQFLYSLIVQRAKKSGFNKDIYVLDLKKVFGYITLVGGYNPEDLISFIFGIISEKNIREKTSSLIYLLGMSDLLDHQNQDLVYSLIVSMRSLLDVTYGISLVYLISDSKDKKEFTKKDLFKTLDIFIPVDSIFLNHGKVFVKNVLYDEESVDYCSFEKINNTVFSYIADNNILMEEAILTLNMIDVFRINNNIDKNSVSLPEFREMHSKIYGERKKSSIDIQKLSETMSKYIFGQEEAVNQLVNAVKIKAAGLMTEEKPVMSFLFIGPTGTGKTESVKILAKSLNMNLERFDMSEYSDSFTVSKLIGAPNGYVGYDEGGVLSNAIKKHPKSIVLFDEIEKAHHSIFNVLLQILDYGNIADNKGEKISFKDTIIIMTSNAGINMVGKKRPGFGSSDSSRELVEESVKGIFPPEFLNRVSKTVYFNPLDLSIAEKVAEKELNILKDLLQKRYVDFTWDKISVKKIAEEGYSKEYGAREVNRVIEQKIKPLLVDDLLFGKLSKGGSCKLNIVNSQYKIDI